MKKEEIVKALLEFRKMCVYLQHGKRIAERQLWRIKLRYSDPY
mgnify:CR=1 FL=1